MSAPQENLPSPLEEQRLIKPEEQAPLDKGDVQPLNPGEKSEAATERLTKTYADKGKEENARGQKAVALNVENGRKAGLKVS